MAHHPLRTIGLAGAAGLTLAFTPLVAHAEVIAPPAPVGNAVTVTTTHDDYSISGKLFPGTGTIRWVNSDDEMHMMAMARLKPGVTTSKLLAALRTGEENVGPLLMDGPDAAYGGPGLMTAGQAETVTLTNVKPGTYVLICFMTEPDGTPHYAEGMIKELRVRGVTRTEVPATTGTITVNDHGIALPDGFTGQGTYAVTNTGSETHSFSLAHLDAGTSLVDFAGSVGMSEGMGTQPSGGELVAGIDVLAPGQTSYLTLSLPGGHYGYVSPEDIRGPELPAQAGEVDIP